MILAAGAGAQTSRPTLYLNEIVSGLASPIYLTAPPNDSRLFILERPGRIRVMQDGVLLTQPFLDIRSLTTTEGERGLLSMAFHPRYAENGYVYLNHTDLQGHTNVVRYTVSPTNPNVADPSSRKLILRVTQPFSNHNGGLNKFGPDGKLYIALGDGGSANDPHNNGQNRSTLLGSLLRIDVDGGDPYAIPPDNPFVGQTGVRGEIWAYGLRNPWRYSFDPEENRLYIADVGQGEWEEVHIEPSGVGGQNYGWKIMEGRHCFSPSSNCNQEGLTLPPYEYSHSEGCSITGGYVYRGSRIPEIEGHYFFSDYCNGWLRSFRYQNGQVTDTHQWNTPNVGNILSFGEDSARNLYLLSASGRVYRLAKQNNLRGDLNRDEGVDVRDAVQALQFSANMATPTRIQRELGDVNRDTTLDVEDAVLILRYLVGLIPSLPQ